MFSQLGTTYCPSFERKGYFLFDECTLHLEKINCFSFEDNILIAFEPLSEKRLPQRQTLSIQFEREYFVYISDNGRVFIKIINLYLQLSLLYAYPHEDTILCFTCTQRHCFTIRIYFAHLRGQYCVIRTV